MYRYKYELGLFKNVQELFKGLTDTSNQTINNKAHADMFELEIQADIVETVIDEYNAIVEEE